MTTYNQIYGCLAGLAMGDALGMPTECLTPDQITEELGWVDKFVAAPRWHPHTRMQAGQVTDDTGQTLAVLHAYSDDGRLTAESVARQLLAWADGVGDLYSLITGPSTGQALNELRRGADPRKSGEKGKSNGAAYRGAAVGLVNAACKIPWIDQVVEACLPTHGTTVAISGAACVAYATAAALADGANVDSVLAAAREGAVAGRAHGVWAWGTPLEKRIDLAEQIVSKRRDESTALADLYNYVGVDMLVAESVAAAFGLVRLADGDPMKAVVYGANIGGDTDTIAALAGAVCGALRGIDAIDPRLIAAIEAVNTLHLDAEAERAERLAAVRGRNV